LHFLRQFFLNNLAQTSDSPLALEITHSEGIYLFDINGKKFTDLISGISVSNTGHRHPHVIQAIKNQADKYLHLMVYGEYIQSPQVKLAEALVANLDPALNNVYLVNSGSEAIEAAMKLAKRVSGRTEIIAFSQAYHGHTQGAMSIMGGEEWKQAFRPLLPDIRFLQFNNFEDLDQITPRTAAVFAEPVQAEAGVVKPDAGYLQALRRKCTETGTLLVFDEVQTGFGRTGSLFAHQAAGIVPDMLVLAKAMGGGMPIGAMIAPKRLMAEFMQNPILGHITTFGGHPVSAAAALATLNVIQNEKLVDTVNQKAELLKSLLAGHPAILKIRNAGLLMAVELGDSSKVLQLSAACLKKGLIVDWFLFCPTAFRLAPPLTISEEEIRFAAEVIRACLPA
jgi:acetylornithine/succinyldiaminopimelate/putrescine aminotransferase